LRLDPGAVELAVTGFNLSADGGARKSFAFAGCDAVHRANGRANGLADGIGADTNSGANEDSQTNRHGDSERRLYSRRTVAL